MTRRHARDGMAKRGMKPGLPAERLVKISGGVDVEHFQPAPDRRGVRAALGLPLDRPIALTVRNLDPWYAAFNVQQGQKLYLAPQQRVKIW